MEAPRSWYAVAPQLGGSQRGRVVVGGVDLDQREVRRVVVEALFWRGGRRWIPARLQQRPIRPRRRSHQNPAHGGVHCPDEAVSDALAHVQVAQQADLAAVMRDLDQGVQRELQVGVMVLSAGPMPIGASRRSSSRAARREVKCSQSSASAWRPSFAVPGHASRSPNSGASSKK